MAGNSREIGEIVRDFVDGRYRGMTFLPSSIGIGSRGMGVARDRLASLRSSLSSRIRISLRHVIRHGVVLSMIVAVTIAISA